MPSFMDIVRADAAEIVARFYLAATVFGLSAGIILIVSGAAKHVAVEVAAGIPLLGGALYVCRRWGHQIFDPYWESMITPYRPGRAGSRRRRRRRSIF